MHALGICEKSKVTLFLFACAFAAFLIFVGVFSEAYSGSVMECDNCMGRGENEMKGETAHAEIACSIGGDLSQLF